jgi:hypothetical protein
MHDLIDYSDYTAEIVRAPYSMHTTHYVNLSGEPRKQPRRWPKLEASPHGCGSWQQNNPPGRRTAPTKSRQSANRGHKRTGYLSP